MQVRRFVKENFPQPILKPLRFAWGQIRSALGHRRFVQHQPANSSKELAPYFSLLSKFDDKNPVAMDLAHNFYIVGSILASKPLNVLELGMGSGYLTSSIVHALKYNGIGTLTTVDSWFDTDGIAPAIADDFRKAGVNVVTSTEEQFVRQAATDGYDFLISDADHTRSHEWFDHHVRLVTPGGIMFFHDTNDPVMFPGLATIERQAKDRALPYVHFTANSRPGERCNRGLLFVMNNKEQH